MMHDYVGDNELHLTHDLMALTLGVRRSSVSIAAQEFKNAGLMDYVRGHIHMLDREGLQARACECYRAIKDEFDRLYSDLPKLAS